MAFPNPFAYRPAQVAFWTTLVYLALLVPTIYLQETVPPAPSESSLPRGISLAEAWADLADLTQYFHPANSHANDEARAFILRRIHEILHENGVTWTTQADRVSGSSITPEHAEADFDAVVFDDLLSNVTFTSSASDGKRSAVYFEGTNVYVYIRGTDDETGEWWKSRAEADSKTKQLVLVNAHFDSVPSSYGATDDGVGVVTSLQLLRYFTTPGQQPRRGIVVLLNNAEEEFLLGASAFANSPLAPFISTFVNLEGAGAGGKAILFRSTDLEVVSAYKGSPHPFGSVVASDSFKRGLIRSETDYRIWADMLGYRGLDIAFFNPRDRYHTPQDNRRHTSKESIWHMLSSALASAEGLSRDVGDRADLHATVGVWFDLFGDSLVLFALRGLFAWSLTILIVSPLILALLFYLLYKSDRNYLFKAYVLVGQGEGASDIIPIGGWKGFFRFPLAFTVAEAVLFGVALLLKKVQPFIIHSSLYAVLALMFCVFYFVFWSIMRGADSVRPSAFQRTYAIFWLFFFAWVLLLVTAILEDRSGIASGYIVAFWASAVFLAAVISLLENFGLQKTATYAEGIVSVAEEQNAFDRPSTSDDALIAPGSEEIASEATDPVAAEDNEEYRDIPTETSPLIGGNARSGRPTTFSTGYRSVVALLDANQHPVDEGKPLPFGLEQGWSIYLPNWTWLLQFLILGPFTIIITSQLGLTLVLAVHQTGTDGSNLLIPYALITFFTTLLILPITPFIHRISRHIPHFFLAVFIGTLVYCLAAFPFSASSPYKTFLRQTFSVDTGNSSIILTGHEKYIAKIRADLPFAVNRPWSCSPAYGRQTGLSDCYFDGSGLEPRLNGTDQPFAENYQRLVTINATRSETGSKAVIEINAVNSKACSLRFQEPVKDVLVHGSLGFDTRFHWTPDTADTWPISEIALWRRDWETPWVVDIDLGEEDEKPAPVLSGSVICKWADANSPGTVPAVEEAWKYAPKWSIVSIRANPPLVQGIKSFSV